MILIQYNIFDHYTHCNNVVRVGIRGLADTADTADTGISLDIYPLPTKKALGYQ